MRAPPVGTPDARGRRCKRGLTEVDGVDLDEVDNA
jgi:hypothetical protein